MYSSSTHSKNQKSPQDLALQKISSFITRFHGVLLPKASAQGVYRYLSEQEQSLLSKLDNPINSILAGCFAIDSCLSSISQVEQNLTDNILKSLTNFCSIWQKIQNQLLQCVQNKNLTASKIESLWKQVEESTKNLLNYCHQLPYSQQNSEVRRQEKIMSKSQQDITFKIGSMKLFEDSQQTTPQIKKQKSNSLQQQNIRLQEQLSFTQKKVVQLQLKLSKLMQNRNEQPSKQKNHRKYSQTGKEKDNDSINNNWPHFASPPSTSTVQQKQLSNQIMMYENKIAQMRQQFYKQKRRLNHEIKQLQKQLLLTESRQDKQLYELLQQLQDQIESLRQERRHDQRIIQQIQYKLDGMTISRQSRLTRGTRARQSRANLKYSSIYRNIDDQYDYDRRNPSFKKSRGRERIYTNEQVSRSSISMPKIQEYKQYERQKFNWKNQKIRPMQDNFYRGPKQFPKTIQLKHSYIIPQQQNGYQYDRQQPNYDSNPPQNYKSHHKIRTINAVPLVQSKFGKQSILKQQDKAQNYPQKHKKNHGQQRNIHQAKFETRKDNNNYDTVPSKATKWHQLTSNNGRQLQPRLKTSRI